MSLQQIKLFFNVSRSIHILFSANKYNRRLIALMGTICLQTSGSRTCQTAIFDSCLRRFYLGIGTAALCDCEPSTPFKTELTYLLSYCCKVLLTESHKIIVLHVRVWTIFVAECRALHVHFIGRSFYGRSPVFVVLASEKDCEVALSRNGQCFRHMCITGTCSASYVIYRVGRKSEATLICSF